MGLPESGDGKQPTPQRGNLLFEFRLMILKSLFPIGVDPLIPLTDAINGRRDQQQEMTFRKVISYVQLNEDATTSCYCFFVTWKWSSSLEDYTRS